MAHINEKNVMLRPQVKSLPTYNSYVTKNNPTIKKTKEFEPLTTANIQTINYPFLSTLNSQNKPITNLTVTTQLQNANNKFKFQQNKSKSFDAGQVNAILSISSKFLFV